MINSPPALTQVKPPLETEQLIEASQTFDDSFTHVLSNYLPDSKKQIVEFIGKIILQEKPYLLVSEEGLTRAISLVFGDDAIRDFIFTLHFTFYARFGHSDDHIQRLISSIARGVGLASHYPLSAIPTQINQRLTKLEDAYNIINDNRWLSIILMIQLFIRADVPSKK